MGLQVTTVPSGKKTWIGHSALGKADASKGLFKHKKGSCLKLVSMKEKMLKVWVTP